jgi:hypothetical protein
MHRTLIALLAIALLAGCAATFSGRDRCASGLDAAWQELDAAKIAGFAGTVNFAKAVGLLTSAKTQQALENFERCADEAERARFYIRESRTGR